jgi:hypothetical protein
MTFLLVFLFTAVAARPPESIAVSRRVDACVSPLSAESSTLHATADGRQRPSRGRSPLAQGSDACGVKLDAGDEQIPDIIDRALDPGVRLDATVRERFPDLTRVRRQAIP